MSGGWKFACTRCGEQHETAEWDHVCNKTTTSRSYTQMNSSSATGTSASTVPQVYSAISAITAKLAKSGISKNQKNSQQGYKFRGIDDVYNALATELAEHKLCILPRVLSREVTERTTKSGSALFYVVLDVEFDFVSATDGSSHTVRVVGEAMDSGDKATNKAMSAAYKYACIEAFCIPTEGDNDADATSYENIEPRGDLSSVDVAEVGRWVSDIKSIVTEYGSDEVRLAEHIRDAHQELTRNQPLYIAVADALAAQKIISKANWKTYVRAGNGQAVR